MSILGPRNGSRNGRPDINPQPTSRRRVENSTSVALTSHSHVGETKQNSTLEALTSHGHVVVPCSLTELWEETKAEFIDYHRWITLERTNMQYKVLHPMPFLDLVIGRNFKECEELFGDPRALSLVPTNDSNRHKRPFGQQVLTSRSSGMGWGTSYFDGFAHLKLQVEVAENILEPLYASLGEVGDAKLIQAAENLVAKIDVEQVGHRWMLWLNAKQPVPPDEKIPSCAKKVWQALKAIRRALMSRTKRIQGQMPENSCLAFCTREENTRLFLFAHHPVHGIPCLRMTEKDWAAQPFKLPSVTTSDIAKRINSLCKRIRKALAGIETRPAVMNWVEQYREVLNHSSFELDKPFTPTTVEVPQPPVGNLILWQGPHWTVTGDNQIKYTTFVDAVPRTFFSEDVWAFIWECHKVCVADLGGGSYRDSYFTWHYMKSRGLSSAVHDIPKDKQHYFGAPTDKLNTVCIVPERFRIKRSTTWGMIHIDRAPLPVEVEEILSSM